MRRKGQAAMEFLMTYGWAILAAVIVIAVLASFGVFSPDKYIPTSCVIEAPWGCDQNQVAVTAGAAGVVDIVVLNGGGQTYESVTIELTGECSTAAAVQVGTGTVADGESNQVTITCQEALTAGDKIKSDVVINYMPSGGSLSMTASGDFTAEAK